jgi:STE24 endopeptidase
MLGLALLVGGCAPATGTAAVPPLRTVFDARVDRIGAHALLTLPPRDLVDPARQRAAKTITDLRQGLFFFWAAAQVAMFAWLWRSGRAARLRDFLRRGIRSRWGYRAAFGGALGLAAPLAGLPFAFISYRVGFNVGLTEEVIGNWLLDYLINSLTGAVLAALAVAVVLELVDRTRLWYLAYLALLFAASIEIVAVRPVVIAPLTTRLVEVPIAAAAPVEIANASARTRTLTAATAGIGRFTRIVLGDVLVAAATPAEIRYVIAHENAHVRHDDNLKITLFATMLFVFAVAIAVLVSDRIGFRRDDDAVSRLALVGALLGVTSVLMLPLFNAYSRGIEYRADEDARRALGDPAGAVRLLVRRADRDLIPLCNRRSSSWFFADHPALASTIAEMRGSEDPCPHSPATR